MPLPIEQILPQLNAALSSANNVVLVAQPGAGKTTRVPVECLGAPWLRGKRILVLEPRRLAARCAVEYMASARGERVGDTIGYRVRGETKVTNKTRLEVVTEGVLTRILQNNPELENVGLIIFDEFHERSLNGDVGLALSLEIQRSIRADLKLLVMSATLDAASVSTLLANAMVIDCPGRSYPIEVRYVPGERESRLEEQVAATVRRALREDQGDILVFLPGRGEIFRVQELLEKTWSEIPAQVVPLYSDLGFEVQYRALQPSETGKRKVILSTSIAETSLTIDGVRVVVDCGLMRVSRFDPRRGMTGLETVQVSQAASEQRKGRAGRQAPGVCYRLWRESRQRELQPFNDPEITQSDLAGLALELSLWGNSEPSAYSFLTPPPASTYAQGQKLLVDLGATDAEGKLTAHGKAMSGMGVHPRVAHMLLQAKRSGMDSLACDVAALMNERAVLRDRDSDSELSNRWYGLHSFRAGEQKNRADGAALSRVDREARRLRRLIGAKEQVDRPGAIGTLTALAYPERVAQKRGEKGVRYLLRSGIGAELPEKSPLQKAKYLAVAHLDDRGEHAKIFLAEPLDESELREYFRNEIVRTTETIWNPSEEAVRSRERECLGALVLSERPVTADGAAIVNAMLEGIRQMGPSSLPWTKEAKSHRSRSEWLRLSTLAPENWPDLSDQALLATLSDWLGPYLSNVTSKASMQRIDLHAIISNLFSWSQRKTLDELAPSHLELPTGTIARLNYDSGLSPTLSVRLQEMLGQKTTPSVGGGKVAVTIELLSPAGRPLQVTQDLESFWKNSYAEVRKEMQGRYPKHFWPADPANAQPTRRVKPHSSERQGGRR